MAVNIAGASLSHPLFTSCCAPPFLTGGCGPLIYIHILLSCCIHAKKRNIVIYFHEYVSILTLVGFSGPYIGISFPMSPYCKSS